MTKKKNAIPENGIYDARTLGVPKMLILGLQHMFAMFGATVLVPLLTGLDVASTLLFAGLRTLLFPPGTGGKDPPIPGFGLRVPRRLRCRHRSRRDGRL